MIRYDLFFATDPWYSSHRAAPVAGERHGRAPRPPPVPRAVEDRFAACTAMSLELANEKCGLHGKDDILPFHKEGCIRKETYTSNRPVAVQFTVESRHTKKKYKLTLQFPRRGVIEMGCQCPQGYVA